LSSAALNDFKRSASSGQFLERSLEPSLERRPKFDWVALHKSHVERLAKAWDVQLEEVGLDTLVIHSGQASLKYSFDDQHWPFVSTPHFSHWLPLHGQRALLVVKAGQTPRLYMEKHASFWDSPSDLSQNWSRESFEIHEVARLDDLRMTQTSAFIGDDIKLASKIGILPENCNTSEIMSRADFLRTLKSDFEVASIYVANETAARGHKAVKELFEDTDASEFDLHLAYLQATGQTEFGLPYGNIVALGSHCAVLHHVDYGRGSARRHESMLLDAGASYNGYASDVTRTWVKGNSSDVEIFRQMIRGVDAAQRKLVASVKVGALYEDLHNSAHYLLADVLSASGIINCSSEAAVNTGLTRVFFPHGLGHSLGLQVHDVGMKTKKPSGQNKFLRNTSEMTQGQVVTIEPGLYFIPSLLREALASQHASSIDKSQVERLSQFGGIRIEDDILATDAGAVNLSVSSPRI
jgi:Xaa-Pro dipeptidase